MQAQLKDIDLKTKKVLVAYDGDWKAIEWVSFFVTVTARTISALCLSPVIPWCLIRTTGIRWIPRLAACTLRARPLLSPKSGTPSR